MALLPTVPVGRIGVSIRALPVILPVNFAVLEDKVIFSTLAGTKLDAAAAGAVVAFEVDSYSPDGTSGWSVLVQGLCSEITSPTDLAAAAGLPLRAWALDGRAPQRFVRIDASFVSGRRFGGMKR